MNPKQLLYAPVNGIRIDGTTFSEATAHGLVLLAFMGTPVEGGRFLDGSWPGAGCIGGWLSTLGLASVRAVEIGWRSVSRFDHPQRIRRQSRAQRELLAGVSP